MNDAIDLTRKRDRDFTAAVEAQSGPKRLHLLPVRQLLGWLSCGLRL